MSNTVLITGTSPGFVRETAETLIRADHIRLTVPDLEEKYRRVINRNGRLHRLVEMQAAEIIVRNEKRMLHAAVDDLLEDEEVALTVAHIGIDTFANYLAYIAEINIDISPADNAAPGRVKAAIV